MNDLNHIYKVGNLICRLREEKGLSQSELGNMIGVTNKAISRWENGRGDVYFGLFDNGDIKGQVITDSTIKDVSEMISTNIDPRIVPTIENLVIDNKNVLKAFMGIKNHIVLLENF